MYVTVANIFWYSAAGYVHVYIGAIKLNSYSRHKCVVAVSFVTHPLVLFPLHSLSSPLQLPDSSFSLYQSSLSLLYQLHLMFLLNVLINTVVMLKFCSAQTVYADVRVFLHANGAQQIISGNATLLK